MRAFCILCRDSDARVSFDLDGSNEFNCHAIQLVDQYGPWSGAGWQWWLDAGIPNPNAEPLHGLIAAVRFESRRRAVTEIKSETA